MTTDKALDRAAILARRADLLAAPAQQVHAALLDKSVMIFRLGADRFALPLASLAAKGLVNAGQKSPNPADEPALFQRGEDGGKCYVARPMLSGLLQVLPLSQLAAVPGAPPEVAGLMQVRGEVRPIYHLRHLLGLTPNPADSPQTVLLLRHPAGDFGIAIDDVEEVRAIPDQSRRAAAPAKGHTGWTTEDLIPVLSVELLLEEK